MEERWRGGAAALDANLAERGAVDQRGLGHSRDTNGGQDAEGHGGGGRRSTLTLLGAVGCAAEPTSRRETE